MTHLAIYAIVGLTVTWLAYLGYMWIASKAMEGQPAPELANAIPGLGSAQGPALVYCYSPNCGPCRHMSPLIDQLAASGKPVFKIDIADHVELARQLGVRATPTILLVRDGVIEKSLLGEKRLSELQALLP